MSERRTVASVTREDSAKGGRPLLYAYGRRFIAELADRSQRSIRRAEARGVKMQDPVEVVAWALAQRGYPRLGDAVLERLGREARYSVDEEDEA